MTAEVVLLIAVTVIGGVIGWKIGDWIRARVFRKDDER
jgi:uncharacterized membrane protein YfcA